MFVSGCAQSHRLIRSTNKRCIVIRPNYRQPFKETPASLRLPEEQPFRLEAFGRSRQPYPSSWHWKGPQRAISQMAGYSAAVPRRPLGENNIHRRLCPENLFSHAPTTARFPGKDSHLSLSFIAISGSAGQAERTPPLFLVIILIKMGGLSIRLALD